MAVNDVSLQVSGGTVKHAGKEEQDGSAAAVQQKDHVLGLGTREDVRRQRMKKLEHGGTVWWHLVKGEI